MTNADIIIIGAGISGSVLAERYARAGKKVCIIEKRDHIAGNCYDFVDDNGILVSKYGAHLFHTNYEDVWAYVNRFSDWYPWEHRVEARVGEKHVPIPVNIRTVNELYDLQLETEAHMEDWLSANRHNITEELNGRDAVLSKVGEDLYEKMFRHYTKKQWDKYPEELDASVLNRIPVRTNFDCRYFSDKYQALPTG
ncbi:MAG: NAD(P)-binding protein, partial [Saprospiraceae bacterium]